MNDAALLACTASAWQGEKARCRWCNNELRGRQQRWCSNACTDEFGRNHWWSWASPAARKRDKDLCVQCGRNVMTPLDGPVLVGRSYVMAVSRRTGAVLGVQVHHLVPLHTLRISWGGRERKVRHGDSGCWHHLDGLETLCDDCHHEQHHGPYLEQLAIAL